MSDKLIHLRARMRHKNDTYVPPKKDEFIKMREPSKSSKEDKSPKKTFLSIDGHCLINVDDISHVGIEKVTTLGSCKELAKITDPNEMIPTKTVYTVKIRSSNGFILWSSDAGDKEEITHLYYKIREILKNYGISIEYVLQSEFRL